MEIITGYTGIEHVTSADDASLYRGILGADDYVLEVGSKFEATIIDNNTIKVADGDLVIQGHQARIRANDYEELTINNGVMGEKRNDLIVARYEKDTDTGIESIDLIVKEGQSGSIAQDPTVELGDISEGAAIREFPLYRVKVDGLSITSVDKLFDIGKTLKDLDTHMADYATLKTAYEKGKVEYIAINGGEQATFAVAAGTNLYFVLSINEDDKTTAISVTRFTTTGLVYTVLRSGSAITIQTNTGKTNIYLTPANTVRGFVIRTRI